MNSKHERKKIRHCIPTEDDEDFINDIPPGCHFSQDTLNGLIGLGQILRKIHNRLIGEGYSIIDGTLVSPSGETLYERK